MKKISTLLVLFTAILVFQSSKKSVYFSSQPPQGFTGASGSYCVACHSSFPLNSSGGSVKISGLPTSNYTPGNKYTFSLIITHSAVDRKRWGFSIAAVDNAGTAMGTFSSTNANAQPNGDELSHSNAVVTGARSTFTYANLQWTAPATAGKKITFYYVGNAADHSGSNSGDYIYSGVTPIALPISLNAFSAVANDNTVQLSWQTAQEVNSNFFSVEKSDDGQVFYSIDKVFAAGNASTAQSYKYTDEHPSFYGRSIFYRLKLIDKDGSYKYSSVVSVVLKAPALQVSKVWPTIFKAGSMISAQVVADKNQQVEVVLTDVSGRVLQHFPQSVAAGNNVLQFMVNGAAKGMVYARFIAGNNEQTIPLFVK